jgi:anaerobic ribonucleoside-triphosphate reductase activating protein
MWVQGCSLGCPGCFNRHLWPEDGATDVAGQQLLERILSIKDIEGITFLGGEPFEQADALAWLAARVRQEGLSVMTFTGFSLAELSKRGPAAHELLQETDLLVDGRYVAALPDHNRPWVGSTNQQFHFLTNRYRHLKNRLGEVPDRIEIRFDVNGAIFINGMAGTRAMTAIKRAVADPARGSR